MGLSAGAIALLLALSLLVGTVPWFGAEATTIATTALVVLATGYENDTKLVSRLLDTAIGVGVGLVVNLTVWPPLRRRTAALALNRIDDGIGELLTDMADGLATGCEADDVEGWLERSRDLDEELDHAWALVRHAQESARWNPRRSAREVRDPHEWRELMHRMEQVLAETRSLAHTWARAGPTARGGARPSPYRGWRCWAQRAAPPGTTTPQPCTRCGDGSKPSPRTCAPPSAPPSGPSTAR